MDCFFLLCSTKLMLICRWRRDTFCIFMANFNLTYSIHVYLYRFIQDVKLWLKAACLRQSTEFPRQGFDPTIFRLWVQRSAVAPFCHPNNKMLKKLHLLDKNNFVWCREAYFLWRIIWYYLFWLICRNRGVISDFHMLWLWPRSERVEQVHGLSACKDGFTVRHWVVYCISEGIHFVGRVHHVME